MSRHIHERTGGSALIGEESRLRQLLIGTGAMSVLERTGLRGPLATAWHLARRPHTARHELALLRDYWAFRRTYGPFLCQGAERADPARKALIVSLTDWVAQVKAEGMLAKAMQLRGITPVILTFSSCQWAVRYFRLFGFRDFVFLDELAVRAPSSRVDVLGDGTELAVSARSLLQLQHRGVDVGRHALSLVTRQLRSGTVDLDDPEARAAVERALRQSMAAVLAAEAAIERVQPRVALFLEKGYTPYGEVFDVLLNRGVDTIQWLHSHRADALALKRYTRDTRHDHPFSLSLESWSSIKNMLWTEAHERALMAELRGRYEQGTWFSRKFHHVGKRVKSSDEVRQQLRLDPSKKTAVVFSHMLSDATFFYGENLFDDYEQWLVETVRVACQNTTVNWVIKLHPDYVWKLGQAKLGDGIRDEIALRANLGTLPPHVQLLEPGTDISTLALFAVTDYCLTVRGTIGIEMPCFGIPVFTAGTGRYSGLGFTIDSSTREEYLDRVRRIQDFPPLTSQQTELAKKHAYALLKLRPSAFTTFEMVQVPLARQGHPLDHNVIVRAHSFRELEEADDLRAFGTWVADSTQLDFLNDGPAMIAS